MSSVIFATGISDVLGTLQKQSSRSAQRAEHAFAAFCEKEGLPRADFPPGPGKVNAAFRETRSDEVDQLIEQSRFHDLLVVKAGSRGGWRPAFGRACATHHQCPTSDFACSNSIAAPDPQNRIGWKDAIEAARSVTAAMPILEHAEKIFVVTTSEDDEPASHCESVVNQLAWHGLTAESHSIVPGERDAAHALLEIARAAGADLLVMGAFGHNSLSETILGGFTQGVLEDASLPVFMLH